MAVYILRVKTLVMLLKTIRAYRSKRRFIVHLVRGNENGCENSFAPLDARFEDMMATLCLLYCGVLGTIGS